MDGVAPRALGAAEDRSTEVAPTRPPLGGSWMLARWRWPWGAKLERFADLAAVRVAVRSLGRGVELPLGDRGLDAALEAGRIDLADVAALGVRLLDPDVEDLRPD